MAKGKKRAGKKKRATKRARASRRSSVAPTTVVQLRFQNEGSSMAKKRKSGGRKKLHGAAAKAHAKKMKRGHYKRRASHGGGAHHTRRRRRRNPGTTFVQALGKVVGGAAAMFGSGVLTTIATAKVAPGNPLSLYGIPAGVALLGAGIATKMPIVGAGVAAGAAAPFVLPVASMVLGGSASLSPSTAAKPTAATVSALRAVAMSSPHMIRGVPSPLGSALAGVSNPLGAVSMSSVYAD